MSYWNIRFPKRLTEEAKAQDLSPLAFSGDGRAGRYEYFRNVQHEKAEMLHVLWLSFIVQDKSLDDSVEAVKEAVREYETRKAAKAAGTRPVLES